MQESGLAKWEMGLRLTGWTERQVEGAFEAGAILPTHRLRPTGHFSTAATWAGCSS